MELTLKQLAELTNSITKGDETVGISSVATLQDAISGQISFINNPRYKKYLASCKASAIIISPKLSENYSGNALINPDPYLTFAKVVYAFNKPETPVSNIHPQAVVSKTAKIGKNVNIAANAVIEDHVQIANNVSIGAGCVIGESCVIASDVRLYPNVTLYYDTKIGSRTIIHSGVVIGADGFGYAPTNDKTWYKILQIGNVVIESDVEIGANTTIDRAALGSTIIGKGVKLDDQIQIAHNTKIDEHTVIAGGTLIAGSTTIGKRCQIAGAVAIGGHLQIHDDVIITGRGMVAKSIPKPGVYSSGIPLDENRKWRKNVARFKQLDEMAKALKKLEK